MAAHHFQSVVLSELRALREANERIEQHLQQLAPWASHGKQDCHEPHHLLATAVHSGGSTGSGSVELPRRSQCGAGQFIATSLPLDWPRVLRVRSELWNERSSMSGALTFTEKACSDSDDVPQVSGSFWAIDPNSRPHLVYNIASLFVLFYDLTLLPYILARDLPLSGAIEVLAWAIPSFWTIDVVVTCITGVYCEGEMIMDLRRIWRRYSRTWFLPDICVVLCDWVSIALAEWARDERGQGLRLLKFTKLGRLVRIAIVLRLLRVVRIMEDIAEAHLTEGHRLAFRLITLLTGILWTTHLLACVWLAVGTRFPSDTGHRWTQHVPWLEGTPIADFEEESLYHYMVAFHWAAGQIAQGAIDIMPVNSWERVVFVLAMMFGFLFGSTLVSMLAAAMMDYQMMQKDRKTKLRVMRMYLRENAVPSFVAVHVQKQLEQRLAHRERLEERDVAALQLLSSALRAQLRFEIQRPYLSRHPIFRLWISMDVKLMHRASVQAVSFLTMRPKDDLFSPGADAEVAYTLVSGSMAYRQYPDSSAVQSEQVTDVEAGQWLSEAALFVEWTHVGKAEATVACQLLTVGAEALSRCLSLGLIMRDIAVQYCKEFHKRVISAVPPHSPYPTDLEIPFTDYCDLVVSMDTSVQVVIGRDALRQLSLQHRGARAMDKLVAEVESSKSVVVVSGEGSVIRVVSLVALRIVRDDGRILMQVGKWDGAEKSTAFQLPGAKQDRSELVGETIERLFETKLQAYRDKLEILGTSREIQENISKDYGVHTRYLRSICSARLVDNGGLEGGSRPLVAPKASTASLDLAVGRLGSIDAIASRLLDAMVTFEVCAISRDNGQTGSWYAWFPPELIEQLNTSAGERVLQHCVSTFSAPPRRSACDTVCEYSDSGEVDDETHRSYA